MPKCIECENFDNKECTKSGFYAKCPAINLECAGYKFSDKNKCLKNYADFCEYRILSDAPFSADWCKLKNTYCNNNKLPL